MAEYKYCSLCKVYETNEGQARLKRLADVYKNIIVDGFAEEIPDYNFIYANEGQFINDYIGVWNWDLTPNKKDPSKNYIISEINKDCVPIEVVILSECATIQDVVQTVRNGIDKPIRSDRIMYACRDIYQKKYVGILCTDKELKEYGSGVRFKDSVICVPQYEFLFADVNIFDDCMVYDSFDIDPSDQVVYVKDVFEVIKEKVMARASWTVLKQKGLTKREYKNIHEFIDSLPLDSLAEEVASLLNCSINNAENLITSFKDQAVQYIDGDTVENEILSYVMQNNPEFTDRCKELLSEDWRNENKDNISKAEASLNNVKEKIETLEIDLGRLNQVYANREKELQNLEQKIADQEKLASDVESEVKNRIEKAKDDAATFIATQAFVQPKVQDTPIRAKKELSLLKQGEKLPSDTTERYDSWESLIELLQVELEKQGVTKMYSDYVAAFMYAAYIDLCPIILIGPNGHAIADAFSACVSGRTCAYLECDGKYNPAILNKIDKNDDSVVLIENLFNPEWNSHINNYTETSSKFLIAVTPYAEDLLIEPKGILNYWVPMMTELFVYNKPYYEFIGGKKSKNFKNFKIPQNTRKSWRCLNNLRISPLTQSKLSHLLTQMFLMVNNGKSDINAELLIAGIPCAYIMGELDCLNGYRDQSIVDQYVFNALDRYVGEVE